MSFVCASLSASQVTKVIDLNALLIENKQAHYYEIYPKSHFDCGRYPLAKFFKPLTRFKSVNPVTMYDKGLEFPSSGILYLPSGRVFSDKGVVLSSKNELLNFPVESFLGGGRVKAYAHSHRVMNKNLSNCLKKNEILAVLATQRNNNYNGWLFRVLPYLHLLQQSNLHYDKLYLPQLRHSFQKETLELLRISLQRDVFTADQDIFIESDSLLVPRMEEKRKQYPKWVVQFLRDTFLPHVHKTGKRNRIYIARNSRGIINEEELLSHLYPLGFQKVYLEKLSFLEQVQLFSEAEYVIGAHGAGFSNIVFCPQDVIIIEIFNQGWLSPTYWGLSQHLKQTHHCILGKNKDSSDVAKGLYAMKVSIEEILKHLPIKAD